MERLYKLKKGLDLKLKGQAAEELQPLGLSEEYAISPSDFNGIIPRLVVKEGDSVLVGSTLFVDKSTEKICIVSPVSGIVSSIERGERRKVLYVRIKADGKQTQKTFTPSTKDANAVKQSLLDSGLFGFIRQRPYDVIASPEDQPKGIFISAFSKMPLAASRTFILKGQENAFKAGIAALRKIAPVYVGISPEQKGEEFLQGIDAEIAIFDGPNPSGNVGVQINHIAPINKGEVAWTTDPQNVVAIGKFFTSGEVSLARRIAIAGSQVSSPSYIEALIGAPLKNILTGKISPEDKHQRVIAGNPLVGAKTEINASLPAFISEICIIPEGDDTNELFGWITPRFSDFSVNRSYFSWLLGKNRSYDLDCRVKGGERHMIMSGEYDRVFPMDIYAGYLIKAIITGDIDRQEALGIYEVAPEDFAVAEFVDSSKLELQRIVREGLDILRKENA